MTLADAVRELIANGDALRKAGVRDLRVGDLYVTLAPPDPVEAPTTSTADPPASVDPLDDPATFGRISGVPGFSREDDR